VAVDRRYSLQLLPDQRGTAALHDQIGETEDIPGWLAGLHHGAGTALSHGGNTPFFALVTVTAVVGLTGLAGRPWRSAAAAIGAVAATVFWILGQNIGQLYSGQATDPNTGPLIVLMALALDGTTARPPVPLSDCRSHGPRTQAESPTSPPLHK
jgi:hypothetical protein